VCASQRTRTLGESHVGVGPAAPFGSNVRLPLEPLDDAALEAVHAQALRILSDIGTEVHDDAMLRLVEQAGQEVDGTRVRWDPDFVMQQLALAPSSFSLTGRAPNRTVTIGGGSLVHSPVGGP